MSSKPKLTVITTVYNCERFIEESLRSVLDQSYTDFQWVLLNDGSTDSTWRIVSDIVGGDERVDLVDSRENKKIPTRRNEAIALARGEYIAIHDGDDISLPHRFETQVRYLDVHENVFCVGGHAISIDHDSEQTGIMSYPPIRQRQIVMSLLRLKQNPMIDPTTMFRKADFDELGGYTLDKSIYTVPDMDLWARALIEGKQMANIPEMLIYYRKNPDGMTQKHKSEMIDAHMQVWRRFRDEYHAAVEQGAQL
tara:strand:+ start:11359 stop:12114 length:756 start_codon:yes stop_codon:yes gene_type:complete